MAKRIIKIICVFALCVSTLIIPAPQGVESEIWKLFGLCLGLLAGLILKPYSEPIISLIILGFGSFAIADTKVLYSGFALINVWFILAVLLACIGFRKTGLGKRIAYILLKKFSKTRVGQTSLGLGYILMLCDLLLSPATGSNTSRSAIVFPIFRGVAESFDSTPENNPRKIGAYLELLDHVVTMSTAVLFLTGMASNAVIASTIKNVVGIELTWGLWFKAALLPGLLVLLLSPWMVYKIFPPEMKEFGNISSYIDEQLEELGKISSREIQLLLIFFLAILGWLVGPNFGIDMYVVAFGFLALELLVGILDWKDIIEEHSAWHMYVWSSAFFGLSGAITAGGFYTWLARRIQSVVDLSHMNGFAVMIVLLLFSFATKYFFVSNAAYIASIYPVILTVANTTQVNMMTLVFMLAFFGGYGALVCNYGNGASIYIYSNGYVEQKDWYIKGTLILAIIFIIFLLVGLPYWNIMGLT